MGVSPDAVKFHLGNVLGKLGLSNRADLRLWTGVARGTALARRRMAMDGESFDPDYVMLGQVARTTRDTAAAREWYRDALGLAELYTFGNLAFFDLGGVRLMLTEEEGGGGPESLLYLRVPAINALFPNYRDSMLDALGSIMHDHGVWVNGELYPRYACDYGTPRLPPASADYPEPFLYTYCRDDDPAVLIRGAKNAPRPAGDDTAGPPPGADLGKRTDPTPKGRYSVPTPYGGPVLPIEPPS